MKHFLCNVSIGIIFFFILLLPIECFVVPNVPNSYSYKYNYVEKHKDDISILLMGNSYFENSINPNLIGDSIFDLAVSARWIYYDKELLAIFIPQMSNLSAVVYPIGYKMPFINYEYNPILDFQHEKYMHVWYNEFPQNILRWFAITHGGRVGFEPSICDKDWNGYVPLEGNGGDTWKEQQNILPEIIYGADREQNLSDYTHYLIEMARICQENEVRFIAVTPPCHDSFNENTRTEGMQTLFKIIHKVQEVAPLEYKNFLFDNEFRADSLYFNCSHLNTIGADKFALRIKEDFNL